jgi:hypothetical protein
VVIDAAGLARNRIAAATSSDHGDLAVEAEAVECGGHCFFSQFGPILGFRGA